jgi:phospholipase/lecithinase/hemolysin
MKRIIGLMKRKCLSGCLGLMVLALGLGSAAAQGKSQPFSHIFVFGDSLSDTGNFYRLSGGFPPSPYYNGRFCNGPVWVEHLAGELGMAIQPGENFAVAGATTGTINYNNGFLGKTYPGLLDEVTQYQELGPVSEPARALYIVEAGANDFLVAFGTGMSPQSMIANGVSNTVFAIQELAGSGARHILVMNVPDLGITPFGVSSGMGPALTQLSAVYNQYLSLALDQLAAAGVPTIRLDSFTVLQMMFSNPSAYNFSNVTAPYLATGGDVNTFLFWDDFHPTTRGHQVLAEVAVQQLLNTFLPSDTGKTPAARVNALNGLVNAGDRAF